MMSMLAKKTFVIIGGATRAGTTSLFEYLSFHRDICASSMKETRFFLDENYPIPVKFRYRDHPLEKYFDYFSDHSRKIFLEATPDYLYSPGTPRRVYESLDNVKWIFILRDPIERLISWYHFGRQTGELDSSISMDEFLKTQLDGIMPSEKQVFRALEQGNYSRYLKPFFEIYKIDKILVVPFGLLEKEPRQFMKIICNFIEIDDSCYNTYQFLAVNASFPLKRVGIIEKVYWIIATKLYFRVYDKPIFKKRLHALRVRIIEPIYYYLNSNQNTKRELLSTLNRRLINYYANETVELEKLLGYRFSWT